MKIVIDIPDHIYSMVTNTGTFGCYRFNTSKAIRQGIPLDMTRAEIYEHFMTIDGKVYDKSAIKCMEIIDKYKADKER